jgi:periplasmic protein TonB
VTSAAGRPPKDIWSKDENVRRAQGLSVLVHALAALLLVIPLFQGIATVTAETPRVVKIASSPVSNYIANLPPGNDRAGGGGGGGDRNPIPASEGRLPKTSLKPQLARPVVAILNLAPRLPVEPTLLIPPTIEFPEPDLPNLGDPMASTVTDSNGPGSRGGIGTGHDGGVGPDSGPGFGPGDGGGFGGKRFRAGTNGIGEPVCIYCPQPAYTDEARKGRYQGVVLLETTILPDGTPTDVRVVRGLGMGLDEKAIEAVRQWRFKPVIGPGNKAITVDLSVEVNFRLL